MPFIFPRKHRHYKVTQYLMIAELPITIVILTLTGIASHDLYRTLLWQDGADNGFNSSPDEELYAAANYRPYTSPLVWSSFMTNYNLVLGVLSTFFLIVKYPLHAMQLFFPPVATFIQGSLIALYIVSARYQAGPDMSDPKHPQPGPPWYITKNCNVAAKKSNIGYCQQAKSLFAVTIILIVLYAVQFGFVLHSCFITDEERNQVLEEREEKRVEKEFEAEIMKSPSMIPLTPAFYGQDHPMLPRTPGYPPLASAGPVTNGGNLFAPHSARIPAFNRLGSSMGSSSPSSDLPLRNNNNNHHDLPTPPIPSQPQTPETQYGQGSPMYFPPPPKKPSKK